ncbi:MAG: YqiA/YcfP family alpha/beta fold hydrolase [Spongiibacteraceae bacterium]|jgi:predicted esterase YcpF (UPF0227 family)|nr:YqiA/YcfP family alpha/beta fold hydrolase [Spongiibacteraceae bacterium]
MSPPTPPVTKRPLLVYIHGFLSSSHSAKAEETAHFLRDQPVAFRCPQLSDYPDQAWASLVALAEAAAAEARPLALIGSSLGGYYATALAERYGLRAVVINPAVQPAIHRFHAYLGPQHNPYTGHRFTLTESHRQALAAIDPAPLQRPDNLWLLAQSGDEVLDYRHAMDFYAGCRQTIEPGGNHRFDDYARHLPAICAFLGLPLAAAT